MQLFTALPPKLVRILVVCAVLRLSVMLLSYGSNDVRNWFDFVRFLGSGKGLCDLYRATELFNNPPLPAWLAQIAFWFSQILGLDFPLLFRLPAVVSDLVVTCIVWSLATNRANERVAVIASAAYAALPTGILINAFHGNTDPYCLLFSALAVWLLVNKRSFLLAGMAFGAAINFKLLPLVIFPALVFSSRNRSQAGRFLGGFTLALLPYLGTVRCVDSFISRVVQYHSNPEPWGVLFLIKLMAKLNLVSSQFSSGIAVWYNQNGGAWILLLISIFAIFARLRLREDLLRDVTLSMVLFLILASGFGVQYLIYPLPFLLVIFVSAGIIYGAVSTFFLLSVYSHFLAPELPFETVHQGLLPFDLAIYGSVTWVALVLIFIIQLKSSYIRQTKEAE